MMGRWGGRGERGGERGGMEKEREGRERKG